MIGELLREAREARGMSQREASARANGVIGFPGISRIESGQRYPTLRTLEALSIAYNCTFTIAAGRIDLELHNDD